MIIILMSFIWKSRLFYTCIVPIRLVGTTLQHYIARFICELWLFQYYCIKYNKKIKIISAVQKKMSFCLGWEHDQHDRNI